jgi:hypothetical protein
MIVKGLDPSKQYDWKDQLLADKECGEDYECIYCWKPRVAKPKPRVIKMKRPYWLLVTYADKSGINACSIFDEKDGWR